MCCVRWHTHKATGVEMYTCQRFHIVLEVAATQQGTSTSESRQLVSQKPAEEHLKMPFSPHFFCFSAKYIIAQKAKDRTQFNSFSILLQYY